THTYPAFLYGYPFPQLDPKDPQAAVKVMYNFSYTLMQPDDLDRSANLHWLTPSTLERYVALAGQILFYGSRFSGPIANSEGRLSAPRRRGLPTHRPTPYPCAVGPKATPSAACETFAPSGGKQRAGAAIRGGRRITPW